ncbi:MAG TPA: outer membrane protein assembly factor BamD [Candidatus Acidoferrales bacterium]|nr:outer membrane protein assembly factor BamD [Candidatus Acidoferrales bacterium]
MRSVARSVLVLLLALFLSACSLLSYLPGSSGDPENGDDEPAVNTNRPAAEIYHEAHQALQSESFDSAIKRFNALESRYPFGPYAQQAQIELIYAYYRQREWEQGIATAQRFLREYPSHPNADYVLYMQGRINFERSLGLLESTVRWRWLNIDGAERDTQYARGAFAAFSNLLRRYPDSPYAADARQRMLFLKNRVAKHDLAVARYYLERGTYVAAANRAQDILAEFSGTDAVLPALDILIDSYKALGLSDMEQQARALRSGQGQAG